MVLTFLRYLHSVLHISYKMSKSTTSIFVAFVIQLLLSFLKFHLKQINYDGMSKGSAVIFDF